MLPTARGAIFDPAGPHRRQPPDHKARRYSHHPARLHRPRVSAAARPYASNHAAGGGHLAEKTSSAPPAPSSKKTGPGRRFDARHCARYPPRARWPNAPRRNGRPATPRPHRCAALPPRALQIAPIEPPIRTDWPRGPRPNRRNHASNNRQKTDCHSGETPSGPKGSPRAQARKGRDATGSTPPPPHRPEPQPQPPARSTSPLDRGQRSPALCAAA